MSEVFVPNSSWTPMNYDNHLAENNICFQGRMKRYCVTRRKWQHLCFPGDDITHHRALLIMAGITPLADLFFGGGFVRDVGLLVSQRHVGDGQMCHVCSHFRCSSWFPSPISRLWVSYRWLLLAYSQQTVYIIDFIFFCFLWQNTHNVQIKTLKVKLHALK